MLRIDSRTVEYTTTEMMVVDSFNEHLDAGYTIADAAIAAVEEVIRRFPHRVTGRRLFTHDFIDHIGEGTILLTRHNVALKTAKGRLLEAQDEVFV